MGSREMLIFLLKITLVVSQYCENNVGLPNGNCPSESLKFLNFEQKCIKSENCEENYSTECDPIYLFQTSFSTTNAFVNEILARNKNIERTYRLNRISKKSVVIILLDSMDFRYVDCDLLETLNLLPVYFDTSQISKFPENLQNSYQILIDGRKEDAVDKIDLFAKFLANCPNSCQLECFQTYKEPVCVDGQDSKNDRELCCGPVGPDGDRGERGSIGDPGCPGEPGTSGITGEPGIRGENGLRGVPGQSGSDGFKGNLGKDGEKGEPGQDGRPGEDGDPGKRGEPGYSGQTGNYGYPGEGIGKRGQKGEPGETGQPGHWGENGQNGEPGIGYHSSEITEEEKNKLFLDTVKDLLETDRDIQAAFRNLAKAQSYSSFCNCL